MKVIVSGYRRSGTSAMMQALVSGLNEGVVVHSENDAKVGNISKGSYIPNPGPLFEIGRASYSDADFVRGLPDGALVKIFFDGLPTLPADKYLVIFMRRDEAEIRESCSKVGRHLRAVGVPGSPIVSSMFDIHRSYNSDDIDHVLGIMDQRKDVELIEVDYADLISDPERVFTNIKWTPLDRTRIDLDIKKAASVINPDYYRSRRPEIQKDGLKAFTAREWEKDSVNSESRGVQ
jgi:hypothetical protein